MSTSKPLSFGRRIALLEHIAETLNVTEPERDVIKRFLQATRDFDAVISVDAVTDEILRAVAEKCREQNINPEYGQFVWLPFHPHESGWYLFSRHKIEGGVKYARADLEKTGRMIVQPDGDYCYVETL